MGCVLNLDVPGRADRMQFSQVVLRNPLPLQSTLFQMCEAASGRLRAEGRTTFSADELNIELAVLYDPAMQATVADPDLEGFDPRRRALFVTQGSKSAWRFDPSQDAD